MKDFFGARLVEWLTAIGTIGAAGAAVWLGMRQSRIQLSANADLSKQGAAARHYENPDTLVTVMHERGFRPRPRSTVRRTAKQFRIILNSSLLDDDRVSLHESVELCLEQAQRERHLLS